MKYVLDTNTVSHLMRGIPVVVQTLTAHSRSDVLLPQPVVAEIEYGLATLPRSRRKERLRQRFAIFLSEFQRVPWSDEVSAVFGQVKALMERRGVRLEDFDVAVVAHAAAIEATLVTDDLEHMSRIPGLRLESWKTPSVR